MNFLAFDSPVMRAISRASDYVLVNLLWVVCSLPVFTAGAAMCARYYVGMKIYRGEEPAVIRSFFSSFTKNFKQTIIPTVVIVFISALLAADWVYLIRNSDVTVYKWGLFVVSIVFAMMVFCLFPIIARYQIRTIDAVKMALGMEGYRFVRIFFAVVIFVLPFVIGIWYFKWAWLICLFVHTVMLYYNSGFFVREFDAVEKRMDESRYPNLLEPYGIDADAAKARCEEIFRTLFYGTEEERIYHPFGEDMGYLTDTGNLDVRTEGMSYGMMMCVQMDKQEEFDRIWKWTKTYMYMSEGTQKGYFAWSCFPDGKRNSDGAAPDGEEYFAMALILAGNRWGNKEGIFDYHAQAKELLHAMIKKDSEGGRGMFDPDNHYIRFVTDADFTDPSYHLPHFYEQFANFAYEEDRDFYKKAAASSREYWQKCCHEKTGLCAEYANFDGSPKVPPGPYQRHDWYYSDAYRTMINIALDGIWCEKTEWAMENAGRFLAFYNARLEDGTWDRVFEVDGTVLDEMALHPYAVIASNASAAVFDADAAGQWVKLFLERGLRSGKRRYYDNCLHFFVYLLLSGNYRLY